MVIATQSGISSRLWKKSLKPVLSKPTYPSTPPPTPSNLYKRILIEPQNITNNIATVYLSCKEMYLPWAKYTCHIQKLLINKMNRLQHVIEMHTFANSAANFWYFACSVWESALMFTPWKEAYRHQSQHNIIRILVIPCQFQVSFWSSRPPCCFPLPKCQVTSVQGSYKVFWEKQKQSKNGGWS